MRDIIRATPVLDYSIRAGEGGNGRTVEAYAAVFDVPTEISDQDGHYLERIAPTAFDSTLAKRGNRVQVLFNHGLSIYGTPGNTEPIGVCKDIRADGIGLRTTTEYLATPDGDKYLEMWRAGAITAQSFQGRFIASDQATPRGGFRPAKDGSLATVTRTEIALKEYGPAVFAAYPDAGLIGIRTEQARALDGLEASLLRLLLEQLAAADAGLDPIVDALCAADCALDDAQMILSQILGEPNPDPAEPMEDGMDATGDRSALLVLSQRLTEATRTRTTSDPDDQGTARLTRSIAARRALRELGLQATNP